MPYIDHIVSEQYIQRTSQQITNTIFNAVDLFNKGVWQGVTVSKHFLGVKSHPRETYYK